MFNNRYRKYLISVLSISSTVILLFLLINLMLDPFGLFFSSKDRNLTVITSERPSKYLLSLRYIPENFDGILVGPSLSDHLDTSGITSQRVYNLSLQGANSAEMRIMFQNVVKSGRLKLLMICLDPYIIRSRDLNDERMRPELRRAALGSTFMLQYYSDLFLSSFKGGEQKNQFGLYGNLHIKSVPEGSELAIKKFVKFLGYNDFDVPQPYYDYSIQDLKAMVDEAHSKKVKIVAFFFPVPSEVLAVSSRQYAGFRKAASSLFKDRDILIDFTGPAYTDFRSDYSNYSDQGHVSAKGAKFLVKQLNNAILQGGH